MRVSKGQFPIMGRLASALNTLSELLAEPNCRRCEALTVCFARLLDDAAVRHRSYAKRLLRALHKIVPLSYGHRRPVCRKCVPGEILAGYLTPDLTAWRCETAALPPPRDIGSSPPNQGVMKFLARNCVDLGTQG